MKKTPLLTVWKWTVVIIQVFFVVVPIFVFIFSYQTKEDGSDLITFQITGLTLLPIEKDILNTSGAVKLTYLKDSSVNPKILISETKLQLEKGISSVRTGFIAFLIFLCAVTVFGLEQLKRMIKTVEKGNPFIRANVWRVYILSTLLFLVPLFAKVGYYLLERWFVANFEFSGLVIHDNSISYFPWMLGGVLLLTIGKIMEQGIKLHNEQALTI